ncbi:MAG: cupin domain-containing protein [Myxococcota bacterium]
MPPLRITNPDEGDPLEARPQILADGRRAAAHLRIIERNEDRVVSYTRYDPGLVIEKHSHLANQVIYVLEGEVMVDDRLCIAGTTLVLEKGTPIGPLTAGPEGTILFEIFDGDTGHVAEDPEGFQRILEERKIRILPEPDHSIAAQGGTKTTPDHSAGEAQES